MPWTCNACQRDGIKDDAPCPSCNARKSAWTVHDAKTRRMTLTRAKAFELLAPSWDEPGAAGAKEQVDRAATEAKVAWSLDKHAAADLARQGLRPAPLHQLIVRVRAKGRVDPAVRVVVGFSRQEQVEQALPGPASCEGDLGGDVRLLLVHGTSGPSVTFPGLEVVDVSEHGDPWLAPTIAISALGRPPRKLPVRPVEHMRMPRLELKTGSSDEPSAPTAKAQVERALMDATAAWCLPRSVAAQLAARQGRPAPAHQLTARVFARPGADLAVKVAVDGGATHALPNPPTVEGGPLGDDVRVLFVYGPGPEVVHAGLHVIDVSAQASPGHAPGVTVSALDRPGKHLPMRPTEAATGRLHGWVSQRLELRKHGMVFEDDRSDPLVRIQGVANVTVRVRRGAQTAPIPEVVTDLEGKFDLGVVWAGGYELELVVDGKTAEHTVFVAIEGEDGEQLDLGEIPPTPLAKNLATGRFVMPTVRDGLQANNQWTWDAAVSKLVDIPAKYTLQTREAAEKRDRLKDSLPADRPPARVTAPSNQYGGIHARARIAKELKIGNCGEKAAWAAILCAEAGAHPVEVFELRDADHGFCVIGRDTASTCDAPLTWGSECVIVDPWLGEVYAATDIGAHMEHFAAKRIGAAPVTKFFAKVRL